VRSRVGGWGACELSRWMNFCRLRIESRTGVLLRLTRVGTRLSAAHTQLVTVIQVGET
jgi:hypothetical protein